MEFLERVWEYVGLFFSGILGGFERGVTSVFGSSNARIVKQLRSQVEFINELESKYEHLSEEELRAETEKFRDRLAAGETLDDIMIEAFAVCREGGKRFLGMRHYDVQMIGGMVLHKGSIAEMVTGEGKTLVATLPAYLNAIEGKGVHVVTVNDYLARRDMEWMAPLYMGLGLTVGAIQSDMSVEQRQKAYACDITYGTNNEFGFDYLRDNMRPAARGDDRFPKRFQQSQGPLHFAIIDEVDNILIDEARTPLIISGPAHDNPGKYADADRIARLLKKETHFKVNEKDHNVTLTDEGVREAEKQAGVESFYTAGNMEWPHLIDNALKAHHLYKSDTNYVVESGKVVIIDDFTGRKMEGRQWSDGLHQAVEAKEGVKIKEETQTLATITLQNFFKLYNKISGMTGTAMTEANEFWKIYELEVIAIPTNRELQRIEHPDVIYSTEKEKYIAVADEIENVIKYDCVSLKDGRDVFGEIEQADDKSVVVKPKLKRGDVETFPRNKVRAVQRKGRPVLVGTVSIEKSEKLSKLLSQRGVKHEVLNAKYHKREAEIVAQAGRFGAVTIATNMAGRGTDIVLGGNPDTMAWAQLQDKYETRLDVPREEWDALVEEIDKREKMSEQGEAIKKLGGLHVIGTERHDARRIDLQLRGRCGRQGDPGSSRFFLSLEDDLMRIFAGEWVKSILQRLGMQEGEAIESPMVTRRIQAAQKKVEERHFENRKNLLEYDEVMDEQRKRVYGYRQQILDGVNCRDLIIDMIVEQTDHQLDTYLERDFGVESFAKWAGGKLSTTLDTPTMFRGEDIDSATAVAKDEAARNAETDIIQAIEENLPDLDEEDGFGDEEWNWGALARFSNTRWGTNFRDRDLKKIGRDELAETLIEKAGAAIEKVDLSEGAAMLDEHYGTRMACAWAKHKFGVELEFDDVNELTADEFKERIVAAATQNYDEKEAEYPIIVGMYRFTQSGAAGQTRLDRESLVRWAADRFEVQLDVDQFKNMQRDEIKAALMPFSRDHRSKAAEVADEARNRINKYFDAARGSHEPNGAIESLAEWCKETLGYELPQERISDLNEKQLEELVIDAVNDRFHPEIRKMERQVLLEIVDTAWKDHLLAMDHLRSAVGLVGYAQLDAKVEYKREGMRQFEQMWQSIGERTTDLVYRIERLDEGFVSSTFNEAQARHDAAPNMSEIAEQQQQAIDNSSGEKKLAPIRNRGDRVGRNDPCPCGSGKKFKQCCMRKKTPAS